jgi:PAS domain S-box-containing protein
LYRIKPSYKLWLQDLPKMKEIRSAFLRYGLALTAFALILLLSFILRKYFSISLDVTSLIILLMIASAWYGGMGPGLLVALALEITLDYYSTTPLYSMKFAVVALNRVVLFVALVSFASARRKAENRLRQQGELLRVMLSSIGDAVIATDTNGSINFINPTAEAITGWTMSQAADKPIDEVFHIINEKTGAPVESPFSLVKQSGMVVGLANHTTLIAKDGREIPIEDSGAPIKDSAGNTIGVILVFHDVTERRHAEQEREHLLELEQAARHQAEVANRLKDEFLATVSHELRTPLNAIMGWIHLLRTGRLDAPASTHALEAIERNGRSQTQLVEDILDVSAMITGKLRLQIQTVNLYDILNATIDVVRPAAKAKDIDIRVVMDSDLTPITGDFNRLQQVIWNLLSNAVKFTPADGHIEIKLKSIDDQIEIVVSDSGKGIRADFLPYVFDRFRQGDGSMTRSFGGLGLGLSIVQNLVELHGGSVSAYSKGEGEGATFTVKLPRRMPDKSSPFSIGENAVTRSVITVDEKENFSNLLEGIHILVVEDEIDARELITVLLKHCKAEVTAVASTVEALKVLDNFKPDILVSDIEMPFEDGYSLMRKIRAIEGAGNIRLPAIALTAHARAEDELKALEAGFQSHIAKPVEPIELISLISRLAQSTAPKER